MKRFVPRRLKIFLKKFFLIDDSPAKVAGGLALGFFWGVLPGAGFLVVLILSTFLRLNRLAAMAGVLSSNMWTTIVFLPFSAALGGWIFGVSPEVLIGDFKKNYQLGLTYFLRDGMVFDILFPLAVGFLIIATTISTGLFFGLYFLLKYKKIKLG